MKYKIKLTALLFCSTLILAGCAPSIPVESDHKTAEALLFKQPPKNKAGVYIYRKAGMGYGLKKDIYIDYKCLGETIINSFFYVLLDQNKQYTISTESEFSPNHLQIKLNKNKNYFIKQYIKPGVMVGGANLEIMDEEKAKNDIVTGNMKLAIPGKCDKLTITEDSK